MVPVAVRPADGAMLPGFRVEKIARTAGFASSVVTDSNGTIYFTTTDGRIHRIEDGVEGKEAQVVASLPTKKGGNGGLLGMAMADDETAVVHYTTWNDGEGDAAKVLDDVISSVDLSTGEEAVIHAFVCDIDFRDNGADSEHHGGNPIVAPDGSVFVGIGDFGAFAIAQLPGKTGGRIWRIDPAGNASEWAIGMRNPYDLAWDPELARIVVGDNGPTAGDEIHILAQGDNAGWPRTHLNQPPVEGMVPPDFVFPVTVAPTGLLRLDGSNDALRNGYLLGAFVTRALYYFPDIAAKPIPHPIPIVEGFAEFVIDVTSGPSGEIYLATAGFPEFTTIYRLHVPAPGDCNGDGVVDVHDLKALVLELEDGVFQQLASVHLGDYPGSIGCDVNGDGMISLADVDALTAMLTTRRRSVRAR